MPKRYRTIAEVELAIEDQRLTLEPEAKSLFPLAKTLEPELRDIVEKQLHRDFGDGYRIAAIELREGSFHIVFHILEMTRSLILGPAKPYLESLIALEMVTKIRNFLFEVVKKINTLFRNQGRNVIFGQRWSWLESKCPGSYDLGTASRKGREGAYQLQA